MNSTRLTASRSSVRLLAGTGLAALAVTLAAPAAAQDASVACADANADGVCDETTATTASTQGNAIVVTGSRLRNVTPYNSPDPIAIVSPEIAKREGKLDLADALQSSPIASGSTQITSALSSNFVTDGGPGAQTIDLRGLGANRTLVLLNGRRAGPAGTRGGVSSFDLNVLPLSIIKDIQILKTGASSVYGSDAVAGVVNILTKDREDGFTLNLNTAVPFEGGGEEYRVSGSWGKDFGRGHILVAADYKHTNELARGDRDYLACPEAYIFNELGSRADLIDPRTGMSHCEDLRWGHIWTYNLIGNLRLDGPGGPNTGIQTSPGGRTVLLQYQYPSGPGGGTLGIPAYGAPAYNGDFGAPAGWFPTGYDAASMAVQNAYHPFVEEQTIIPETDLYTGYAEGSFEISDAVELFGEFLFNRRETYQNGWRQFWNFGYTGDLYGTGAGNYYNYWGGGFQGVNFLSPTGITNQSDNSQKVDYYRGVAGVRGDLGGAGNWRYEIYGQYSKSVGRYRSQQILQDAYDTGYFQYSSCVGTVTPVSGRNCIDIPWADPYFLRGELTPEQIGFLFDWEEGKTGLHPEERRGGDFGRTVPASRRTALHRRRRDRTARSHQRYSGRHHAGRQRMGCQRQRRHRGQEHYQGSVCRNQRALAGRQGVFQGTDGLGGRTGHQRDGNPRFGWRVRQGQRQLHVQSGAELGGQRLGALPRQLRNLVPGTRTVRTVQGQ